MVEKNNNEKKGSNRKSVEPTHMPGKEVEQRLLEAGSEDELNNIHNVLKIEGVPDGTIRGTISKLKKKGQLVFTTAIAGRGEGTKPLAVEAIIQEMRLPVIVNGGASIFDAGVGYGMRALIAGVRLAQELSQMGIAQARPVISMATEMRKAEGMSAQEAGQVAAQDALAGAIGYMSEQKSGKADIATVKNPMMGIMARAMEPALTQAMGKMFGMFGGQPAPQGGQPTQQSGQAQSGTGLPPGWSTSEKKVDEEPTEG